MKLLFIIGMQKSGTSLLNRILMAQNFIINPFLPEGKHFWGDNPPLSPIENPCGALYQKKNGKDGHYLDELDYLEEDRLLLLSRIKETNIVDEILMNKNPYNSVRIAWLKKVFPQCKIVVNYRNPISNIYSLLKRYTFQNQNSQMKPQEWWGIKPKNWKQLISNNKLMQFCNQWVSVNSCILQNTSNIDLFINYNEICSNPIYTIKKISGLYNIDYKLSHIPELKNFNDEYKTGSRLLSKNREFRRSKSFNLNSLNESIQFPPFNDDQINEVNKICTKTWNELKQAQDKI